MNFLLRRLYREQEGQTLYLVAASMVVILGMAALSIDIGFALHAQRELQANTDAAANAGGAAMPNPATTSVVNVVNEYSGDAALGALYNVHHDLNVTGVSVSFACLVTTNSNFDLPPCATSANTTTASYPLCATSTSNPDGGCNAIKVVETATIPTFFAKVFGFKSLTLTATSIASGSGNAEPYHIMLVLDTTHSMATGTDTGCMSSKLSTTYTQEQCAQMGVQTLLTTLAPCAQGQTCTSAGNTPVDQVGIMVFPGICSDAVSGITTGNCPAATSLTNTTANPTYAPPDIACPSTNPPITPYNNDPEYLLLGFQDNYQITDGSGLNTAASLVQAVGAGTWIATDTTNNCGLPAPGGEGTFYAGAIVAAQTYLTNNHTPYIQDIMMLLSDGDATSTATQMGGSVQQTVSSAQIAGMNGRLFSATAECQQAVNAADWAKGVVQSDGTSTKIYSISYGSETSGCTAGDTLTPCQTMQGIASLPLSQYFYSVPQTTGGTTSTVCSGAVPITKLDQVFKAIGSGLQRARLLPASVTGTWTTPTS